MTPAVVVGGDINGLGVVRSLAGAGIPTWLVASDPTDPALRTRYSRKVMVASLAGSAVIEALIDLRSRFDVDPVLFLTREETVEAVSRERDSLTSCYRISMPAHGLMTQLMDKVGFQALAEKHGFPIPRAVHVRRLEDLGSTVPLVYPLVLKPVVKTPAYVARCKKAYKVDNREQLASVLVEVDGCAEMIGQEWIEGGDDRIFFCLQYRGQRPGDAVSFTGRKLRSWPPATGGTASCVPAPDAASKLVQLTDAFFIMVGYFGLCSMEFKQDAATGRYLMIEPTVGRTDFQEEVAALNGVNIPYAAYCGELGRNPQEAIAATAPAAWAVSPIDRWSSQRQSIARSFPHGLRRYDALWRLKDPMPWWFATTGQVKARLSALTRPRW